MTRTLARLRVPIGFVLALVVFGLARPTLRSLALGGALAVLGEALRVWAAGHLEKGREVTRSGPYRYVAHPLYVGSAVIGAGLAVASASLTASVIVALYFALAVTAAVRAEVQELRAKFADQYAAYRAGRSGTAERPFSLERAVRNREHRTVVALAAGWGLLALKIGFGL